MMEEIPYPGHLVFVDCETTGLDTLRHEVWEVAIVEYNPWNHSLVGSHQWFIEPRHMERFEAEARAIGSFDSRFPKDMGTAGVAASANYYDAEGRRVHGTVKTDRRTAAARMAELLKGRTMAGCSPWFDAAMLTKFLTDNGAQPGWHYRLLDVPTLAIGSLLPSSRSYRGTRTVGQELLEAKAGSDKVAAHFGLRPEAYARHTAMGDCLWAIAIYECAMGGTVHDLNVILTSIMKETP